MSRRAPVCVCVCSSALYPIEQSSTQCVCCVCVSCASAPQRSLSCPCVRRAQMLSSRAGAQTQARLRPRVFFVRRREAKQGQSNSRLRHPVSRASSAVQLSPLLRNSPRSPFRPRISLSRTAPRKSRSILGLASARAGSACPSSVVSTHSSRLRPVNPLPKPQCRVRQLRRAAALVGSRATSQASVARHNSVSLHCLSSVPWFSLLRPGAGGKPLCVRDAPAVPDLSQSHK